MKKGFFITGTDTEIGKTRAAVDLIRFLVAQGHRVSGLKPIASGCEQYSSGLKNPDALLLKEHSNTGLSYSQVNRYAFEPPIAPHLAALCDDVAIELDKIQQDVDAASEHSDVVVVEAVGGWLVPLNADETVADLAVLLQLPVILVVGIKLGCISHALLSMMAIEQSGAQIHGWVANHCVPDSGYSQEQLDSIRKRVSAPLLAEIRFDPDHNSQSIWQLTD